jgi:hypothetical protein
MLAGADYTKWYVYKDARKGKWWASPPTRLNRLGWQSIDFPSHAEALEFAVFNHDVRE